MVVVLLFVAACIVILIFAFKGEFEWDMLFPLLLAVAGAAIIGIVVSSSIVTIKEDTTMPTIAALATVRRREKSMYHSNSSLNANMRITMHAATNNKTTTI